MTKPIGTISAYPRVIQSGEGDRAIPASARQTATILIITRLLAGYLSIQMPQIGYRAAAVSECSVYPSISSLRWTPKLSIQGAMKNVKQ
jgi:hypothetical protein